MQCNVETNNEFISLQRQEREREEKKDETNHFGRDNNAS